MSLLTLGLWLVSWAAITAGNRIWPWGCGQCGWRLSRASLGRERKAETQILDKLE